MLGTRDHNAGQGFGVGQEHSLAGTREDADLGAQASPQPILLDPQIVATLQVEPERRRCPEPVWCPIYSLQKKGRGILASGKTKTAAIPGGIARIFNAARRQKTRDVCDEFMGHHTSAQVAAPCPPQIHRIGASPTTHGALVYSVDLQTRPLTPRSRARLRSASPLTFGPIHPSSVASRSTQTVSQHVR
jgi:hypothetical protein